MVGVNEKEKLVEEEALVYTPHPEYIYIYILIYIYIYIYQYPDIFPDIFRIGFLLST
jgi:hypothetical protein